MTDYIYIIHTRECIKCNENIYKIGRTQTGSKKRVSTYPNDSVLIAQFNVNDAVKSEKEILTLCKNKYKQIRKYGIEYFQGDISSIKNDVYAITQKYQTVEPTKTNEILKDMIANYINKICKRNVNVKIDGDLTTTTDVLILCEPSEDIPEMDMPIYQEIKEIQITPKENEIKPIYLYEDPQEPGEPEINPQELKEPQEPEDVAFAPKDGVVTPIYNSDEFYQKYLDFCKRNHITHKLSKNQLYCLLEEDYEFKSIKIGTKKYFNIKPIKSNPDNFINKLTTYLESFDQEAKQLEIVKTDIADYFERCENRIQLYQLVQELTGLSSSIVANNKKGYKLDNMEYITLIIQLKSHNLEYFVNGLIKK
jgi:hypothetical protein